MASVPSELASRNDVGTGSAEERSCEGEFDSDKCPRHPRNDGECRHHWICDKLKEWENKNSEVEMEHREKHSGRIANDRQNGKVRLGKHGTIFA